VHQISAHGQIWNWQYGNSIWLMHSWK